MRLSLAFAALVAVGPAFANASPPGNGIVIPLSKRAVHMQDSNGVVNSRTLRSLATRTARKLGRGFPAYERNVEKAHSFAMGASTDVWGRDDGSGVEPLIEDPSGLWHGTISVGTPPVNITVNIDTGTSQVILLGPLCGTECQGRKIYDPAASSTAKDLDEPFEDDFINGPVIKGEVFTDTVTMAGLTVINQTFGVGSQLPDVVGADALMGMGLSEYSIFKTNTFLDNLFVQGAIRVPQFSLKLAGNDSELFLGGSNSSLFTGEFTTLNVTLPGSQWQIDLDAVNVGDNRTVIGAQAVIDTGVSFIAAPKSDVVEFYQAIPGSKNATDDSTGPGIFTFPCNTDPQVSLTFGGKKFPISLSSFNLGKVTEGSKDCIGSIVALPGLPYWALGVPFLENYYTRFDSGAKQVGFAALA